MKKILSFILLFISCIFLSSCGGGVSSEELYLSRAILLEDGSTEYILYNYYGDEIGRFTVPAPIKGEDGNEGNGILLIDPKPSEDGSGTTLTITFTDETMDPIKFDIKDGISVTGVTEPFYDENGEKYVLLTFSDGNTSETPIYLPKGDDGNGIDDFDFNYDPETRRLYVYVSFTNEELFPDFYYDFPAPKDGNGVDKMEAKIETVDGVEQYVITVTYTDKEPEKLYLPKPADPNKWYTSSDYTSKELVPNPKKGDFFFDITDKTIWLKEEVNWRKIVDFKTPEDTFHISFNLSLDIAPDAVLVSGKDYYENIKYGTYGLGAGIPLPLAHSDEYIFKGWSLNKVASPTSGYFTDLTPVLSNLELYAVWEKK